MIVDSRRNWGKVQGVSECCCSFCCSEHLLGIKVLQVTWSLRLWFCYDSYRSDRFKYIGLYRFSCSVF